MKKLFLLLSLVATLVFTGCSDNDNAVNPQPIGKATITGIVYADFDETDTKNDQDVVANAKLGVWLTADSEGGSTTYMEVTTDASGKYSVEIPLGNREIHVHIQPADFRADVKTADGTKNRIFRGDNFGDVNEWVNKGASLIRDIYYND